MKYLKIVALALIITVTCTMSLKAQELKTATEIEAFKGLKKAQEGDIDPSQQIRLDGNSIPIYNNKGKRVQGMEIMQSLMSGDFTPDLYINNNKEIKAVFLRKSTEEEKENLKKMMAQPKAKSKLVGENAISFEATDINGNKYSLEDLKGKVVVMNFWFTACKPCVMEIPELNELVHKYNKEDVVFLGFCLDPKTTVEPFLKKHPFEYNIIPSAGKTAQEYGLRSYPSHIIIGKDSKVAYSTTGLSPNTIKEIDENISSQLSK
jgi:peroxiredoxin